jgi:hypothetical protein
VSATHAASCGAAMDVREYSTVDRVTRLIESGVVTLWDSVYVARRGASSPFVVEGWVPTGGTPSGVVLSLYSATRMPPWRAVLHL